jgi:hypothetical protein
MLSHLSSTTSTRSRPRDAATGPDLRRSVDPGLARSAGTDVVEDAVRRPNRQEANPLFYGANRVSTGNCPPPIRAIARPDSKVKGPNFSGGGT